MNRTNSDFLLDLLEICSYTSKSASHPSSTDKSSTRCSTSNTVEFVQFWLDLPEHNTGQVSDIDRTRKLLTVIEGRTSFIPMLFYTTREVDRIPHQRTLTPLTRRWYCMWLTSNTADFIFRSRYTRVMRTIKEIWYFSLLNLSILSTCPRLIRSLCVF